MMTQFLFIANAEEPSLKGMENPIAENKTVAEK